MDLTSGYMGVKHTSHRVLERVCLERCKNNIESMVSVE